ncbi:hypothetical protein [Magnetococcus marinus]|uniref:hypothetical protein n=1 Tax=Magnetococcus marinus TaxID=1124597 RepID=UPI00003C572C|nr:hypothetical protein [Magnetococcus marinus]
MIKTYRQTAGRPSVGVECHFPECVERRNCRHVYVEEFLRADGSCPHYHPINKPWHNDMRLLHFPLLPPRHA